MPSKEECSKENLLFALQSLNCSRNCSTCKYYSLDDIQKCQEPTPYAVDLLEKFIEEYFEPQPYKLEDLKPDMWVYDIKYDEFCRIDFIAGIYPHRSYSDGTCEDGTFEENRFFPVEKANKVEEQK